MEAKNINVTICVAKYDELDENDRSLVDMAVEATERSYAPYSMFNVGAAVRLFSLSNISVLVISR